LSVGRCRGSSLSIGWNSIAPGKSLRFQNATSSVNALAIITTLFAVRSIHETVAGARRHYGEPRHETRMGVTDRRPATAGHRLLGQLTAKQ
ncbi:MAG TPA: hypothetical protein VF405_01245, partial [Gammaproteobacteria bacterium]